MTKQHYKASTYRAKSSIGYLVKRSHALMLDCVEPALAARGFTFMQYIVFMYLRDGIAFNAKDICSEFRYDSGALTRVIDQLVERGYVERARGVQDRRTVDLRLTNAGLEVIESLIPTVVDRHNSALAQFSVSEVRELSRLLRKLNDTIHRELESAAVAESPAKSE